MSEDRCYICGLGNRDILEQHHIVPRRYGGGNGKENLVTLCPNCHAAVEELYDDRFFEELGVETDNELSSNEECRQDGCKNDDTTLVRGNGFELPLCDEHRSCWKPYCGRLNLTPIETANGSVVVVCDKHKVCYHKNCSNTDIELVKRETGTAILACDPHVRELVADG